MSSNQEQQPPCLIMILSPPYSGSTLLAALLGNSDGMENLGEAAYLANDFHNRKICTCGVPIDECEFWSKVLKLLEADKEKGKSVVEFSDTARAHRLDARRRGVFLRLGSLLGVSVEKLIPKEELQEYAESSDSLFRAACESSGHSTLVDSSKSLLRAEALTVHSEIPTFFIFLSRSPLEAYAARIKRARKRNPNYFQLYAAAYLVRLRLMLWSLERMKRRIQRSNWIEIQFNDLLRNPRSWELQLSQLLGRDVNFKIDSSGDVTIGAQHGYAGNVWRSRQHNSVIHIKLDPDRKPDPLTKLERFAFKVLG